MSNVKLTESVEEFVLLGRVVQFEERRPVVQVERGLVQGRVDGAAQVQSIRDHDLASFY